MGFYKQIIGKQEVELHMDGLVFYGSEDDVDKQYHEYRFRNDQIYRDDCIDKMTDTLDILKSSSDNFSLAITSLVCVNTDTYPVSYGNYWSIDIDGEIYPVINMWAENFEGYVELYNVKVLKFFIVNGMCVVDDLPEGWMMDKPFLKYNLHRGMSYIEKIRVIDWYKTYRKDILSR